MNYTKVYQRNTPQSKPMQPGQVLNNAGGYVFQVTPWVRLDRFLKLGSEHNTYYQRAKDLTKENALCVAECWELNPTETARIICEVSKSGRAPKNDHAIFALALGAIHPSKEARQAAYASKPVVCRTGFHHFQWMAYCSFLQKGSGRGFKRAIAEFYYSRNTDDLAFQMVKYRQRNGFTHKRAIELSNMGPTFNMKDLHDTERRVNLYKWARGKEPFGALPRIVEGHIEAMSLEPKDSKRLVQLISEYKLPWEAIPTWALNNKEVWEALIPTSGLTAIIRNLGNMTACGALTTHNYEVVAERLLDQKALDKARIHPFNVLQALAVYKSGRGLKGNKTWQPVMKIVDALDEAFYKCFKYADVTGKRLLIALDVSGSMTDPIGSGSRYTYHKTDENPNPLSCREAAGAMCLVTLKTEKHVDVVGFSHGSLDGKRHDFLGLMSQAGLIPLKISARQRLDDVVKEMANQNFGGTDAALPFLWALKEKKPYDAVIVWTDNETWAGQVHPKEALLDYRRAMGLNTKLIVCAMTSTGFSIADPNDNGMLDLVGMDSAVPTLISNFVKS